VKLHILSGVILLLIAGITLDGNSSGVKAQSEIETANDTLRSAANSTANSTAEGMQKADDVLSTFTDSTETGVKKYENVKYGISFTYPSYWGTLEEDCTGGSECVIVNPLMGEKLNDFLFQISLLPAEHWEIQERCKCDNLIEFVQYMYTEADRVYDKFEFINDSQLYAGNKYPAWQVEYSAALDSSSTDREIHYEVFTKINNTFYRISIVPFSNESSIIQLPEFRKIIESIEFLPIKKVIPKSPSFFNTSAPIANKLTDNALTDSNGIEILSHSSYTDTLGYLHVVGEIQNNTPANIQFVKVTGTFYDSNNQVVGTDFTYSNPSDIGPGQKAPFELTLLSASIPVTQIDHYNLVGSYQ
jgi:hypothetical protein